MGGGGKCAGPGANYLPSSLGFRTGLGQNGLVTVVRKEPGFERWPELSVSVWHVLGEPLGMCAGVALPPP